MGDQLKLITDPNDDDQKRIEELRKYSHLEVYDKYSILIDENEKAVFWEGKQSDDAQRRYRKINDEFSNGYLNKMIAKAASPDAAEYYTQKLTNDQINAIDRVVASVTASGGRALVEIFILQLAVKSVCPDQDIRLHKGSNATNRFSWREGISLRHLDDSYIVPSLRDSGLLRMNQFGAFMTRSFAENYPFTFFYKAEMAGAKDDWLNLVDDLEENLLDAEATLLYALNLLWKSSERFSRLVDEALHLTTKWIRSNDPISIKAISNLIAAHIDSSEARARLLEVSIHALMQALDSLGIDLGGKLKPLMPMRTANLKHGNLGDVEVLKGDLVVEAWDAKYRTPYLSDAIEELRDKIRDRDVSQLVFGYIVYPQKEQYLEVDKKISEIRDIYGFGIEIHSYSEWINIQGEKAAALGALESHIGEQWLIAYVESLGQRRREIAPIDEPTYEWILTLVNLLRASI